MLQSKPASCRNCPLENAPGPVWGEGHPRSETVFIGQNPGPQEVEKINDLFTGETIYAGPFKGGSGRVLDRNLREEGISRSECFVTNTVKCYIPPRQPVPLQAIKQCRVLLDKELDSLRHAKLYVTLGSVAFRNFTGKEVTTTTNKKKANAWLFGCPWYMGKKTIIPLVHPSYIISTGFAEVIYFKEHLRKVKRWMEGGGIRYEEKFNYTPTAKEVEEYVQECIAQGDFGLDIETSESLIAEEELVGSGPTDIQVIGLSARIGEAVGVPPDCYSLLDPLLSLSPTQAQRHSRPTRLFAYNWAFDGYHLSTQRTLGGFVPFDPMLGLHLIFSDLRKKDLGAACALFTDMPFHKNLAKTQPDRYNAMDTFGVLWAGQNIERRMRGLGLEKLFWEHMMAVLPITEEMRIIGANCDMEYAQRTELACYTALDKYEAFWEKNIPHVNWSSPKQLVEHFARQGLPLQMRKRGKGKLPTPAADDEALKLFAGKHGNKTAKLIQLMRSLKHAGDFTKLHSSDGRAHFQFKLHGQKGGRIQAVRPDIQNIPEEIIGTYPRKIIIPDDPEKDLIVVADFEQIELWLYAFAAQDRPLLEAKKRGDYIYGQFYEEIFKKPFFEEGKPRKKGYRSKSVLPQDLLTTKSGPLGMIYGRGALSLMALGISREKAQEIYDSFFREHAAIKDLHKRLEWEVRRNGYLRGFFGRIRWFPGVGRGSEYLSHPGQANAVDVLIKNALLPFHKGLQEYSARLMFTVHDSVVINCPKKSLISAVAYIRDTMEAPIPELRGFWIPVEVKVGPNWYDVENYDDYQIRQRTVRGVQGASAR